MRRAAARHKRHQAARRCRLKLCSEPRQSFVQQLLDGTSSLPHECFKVYRCTFESIVAFILDIRSRSAVVGQAESLTFSLTRCFGGKKEKKKKI